MTHTSEEWRDCRGWEGFYQVSNLGRVRSVDRIQRRKDKVGTMRDFHMRGRILKPGYHQNGYLVVIFSDDANGRRKTRRVHQLVCEAFNGPRPDGHEVAHNDNTRDNNVATNLRWATHYDNLQDRVRARLELQAA